MNLQTLKKENEVKKKKNRIIKDVRKLFKLKQENEAMKDRII